MKYKEKLIQLIKEGTAQEFQEWLISQPLLEQTAIMRELKQLGDLPTEEGGGNILDNSPGLNKFEAVIDTFEDAILDTKLLAQQLIMAEEESLQLVQKMRKNHPQLREQVIQSIINKDANAKTMYNISQKLIQLEKMDNTYNPENWKELPE